jgi:hypothetical protein
MTLSNEALYDKAMGLSKEVEDNFLELGKSLRQLMDRDPELFQQIIQKSNLGRRRAYYLAEVSRIFDPLPIPRARLNKIGWTKLQLVAKHVTPSNLDVLLQLAEDSAAKELERRMRGEKPVGNAHCVLMYFSPEGLCRVGGRAREARRCRQRTRHPEQRGGFDPPGQAGEEVRCRRFERRTKRWRQADDQRAGRALNNDHGPAGKDYGKERSKAMSDDSKTAGGAQEPEFLVAPEGVEFTVTTYVRSDSTHFEIVNVREGLTSLPLSEMRDDMDAYALVAAWNDGEVPLGATDWRFMTRAEIAEHRAAEEIDVDEPDGNGS